MRKPVKTSKKSGASKWWIPMLVVAAVFLIPLNAMGLYFLQAEVPEPQIPEVPLKPEDYLTKECWSAGYDCLLLETIIGCESGWRMVKNATSSAYGYFQIIDGTERTTPQYAAGQRKFDPYTNIDMGLYLYGKRGTNPWNESKRCWLPRYQHAASKQPARVMSFPERN